MTLLKHLSEPSNKFVVAVVSIYLEYLQLYLDVLIGFQLPAHLGMEEEKPSHQDFRVFYSFVWKTGLG